MTGLPIRWHDEVIGLLVHRSGPDDYLLPAIVLDAEGNVLLGAEILATIERTGRDVDAPILRDYTPERLARLERRLAEVRDLLHLGPVPKEIEL